MPQNRWRLQKIRLLAGFRKGKRDEGKWKRYKEGAIEKLAPERSKGIAARDFLKLIPSRQR